MGATATATESQPTRVDRRVADPTFWRDLFAAHDDVFVPDEFVDADVKRAIVAAVPRDELRWVSWCDLAPESVVHPLSSFDVLDRGALDGVSGVVCVVDVDALDPFDSPAERVAIMLAAAGAGKRVRLGP